MRLDLLKAKLPVLLILVTLAISAMFMAQGATSLLAGALFPLRTVAAAAGSGSLASLPGSTPPDPKAILGRNAFDPSTGPLWPPRPNTTSAEALAAAEAEQIEELAPGQMPPPCGTPLRLIASVHSETAPEWSFASIAGPSGPPLLYRLGGQLQDKTVSEIFPSAVFLRDAGGRMCSLALFSPPVSAAAGTAAAPAGTTTTAAAMIPPLSTGTTDGAISQEELTKGIQQASETKFAVQRSLVDKVLANQAEIMRSARIVPHEQNGQVLGVKLYGIRRNSLLGMLGLQNGDLLRTINGYDMSSPDSALEAYSRLRTASQLTLSVTRRGQAMSMEYQIQQ